MLVALDSRILLRVLHRTDPQHAAVRQAVRTLRGRGDTLVTAPQSVAEFWNVTTRPATARGGFGLSLQEAQRRLRVTERLFQVLLDSPAAYALWKQLVAGHGVMGVQVHDARLVAWMQAHGIAHLLTLNAADFARYQGITAPTPQHLLSTPGGSQGPAP
jgi:predicted nucleic acid-binding protein